MAPALISKIAREMEIRTARRISIRRFLRLHPLLYEAKLELKAVGLGAGDCRSRSTKGRGEPVPDMT